MPTMTIKPSALRRSERRAEERRIAEEKARKIEEGRLRYEMERIERNRKHELEQSQRRLKADAATTSPDGLPAVWRPRPDVRVKRLRVSDEDIAAVQIRYEIEVSGSTSIIAVPYADLVDGKAMASIKGRV